MQLLLKSKSFVGSSILTKNYQKNLKVFFKVLDYEVATFSLFLLLVLQSSVLGDLLCEDLEDLDLSMRDQGMEHSSSRTAGSSISRTPTGSPISLMTAKVSLTDSIYAQFDD